MNMNRNSTTIWIPTLNAITPIPWVNNDPDFSGISEPTLSVLQASYEAQKDNIVVIPDPIPEPPTITPDWDGLVSQCLGGVLHPIFQRLTIASFADNGTSTARGDITDAILTVRAEEALQSALHNLVTYTIYRFTDGTVDEEDNEKALWDSTVTALNFSGLVHLPTL